MKRTCTTNSQTSHQSKYCNKRIAISLIILNKTTISGLCDFCYRLCINSLA